MTPLASTQSSLLYVFTKAPYSNAVGQEGVDAVLMGAAFEQKISLLFLFDGIYQLKSGQDVGTTGIKQYSKTYQALEDFEVDNIYASDLCMQARGLTTSDLIIEIEKLNSAAIANLIAEQDRVFTF